MSSFDRFVTMGCEHPPGSLISVKTPGGFQSGIVTDWWPSNMYESAHYEIFVDGKTLPFERKYVFAHNPTLNHANP